MYLLLLWIMIASIKGFHRISDHCFKRRCTAAALSAIRRTTTVTTTSSISTEHIQREAEESMKQLAEYYESPSSSSSMTFSSPQLLKTKDDVAGFMKKKRIDTVLFDCDGVLYRSPDAIPGAGECVRNLLENSMQVFFVTNNAASNRNQLREKLTSILDLPDTFLTTDMMISSSYSCAQYLRQTFAEKKAKIYVIGSEGLCEELRQAGFEVAAAGGDNKASMSRDELAEYDFSNLHPIDAVVVGHDVAFNFRKMCIANCLLQWNADAPLIATNKDAFDLVGADGRHIPGNGCLVQSIEYSSKRIAINVGKPSKTLTELIASQQHDKSSFDPARCLIVGDRLDTDIRFGVDSGMYSALVMTGVTTVEKLKDLQGGTIEEPLPTVILPSVGLMA